MFLQVLSYGGSVSHHVFTSGRDQNIARGCGCPQSQLREWRSCLFNSLDSRELCPYSPLKPDNP
jgi:hypothetical protein